MFNRKLIYIFLIQVGVSVSLLEYIDMIQEKNLNMWV